MRASDLLNRKENTEQYSDKEGITEMAYVRLSNMVGYATAPLPYYF